MIHGEAVIYHEATFPPPVLEALSSLPATVVRLLDVGAGDGNLRRQLQVERPDIEVYELELLLSLAKISSESNPGRIVVGDVQALPFAEDSFDALTSINTLHEVSCLQQGG